VRLHAAWSVEEASGECLIIRDVGHSAGRPSITNDAEWVVWSLTNEGTLKRDARLFYYDSDGDRSELLHDGAGRFRGFAP
jgi:hypothetical protein